MDRQQHIYLKVNKKDEKFWFIVTNYMCCKEWMNESKYIYIKVITVDLEVLT